MDLTNADLYLGFLVVFALPAAAIGAWLISRIDTTHRRQAFLIYAYALLAAGGVPLFVWLAHQIGISGLDAPQYDDIWQSARVFTLVSGIITLPILVIIIAISWLIARPVRWPIVASAILGTTLLLLIPWLTWYFVVYRYDPRTCQHECFPEAGPILAWFAGLAGLVIATIVILVIAAGSKLRNRTPSPP